MLPRDSFPPFEPPTLLRGAHLQTLRPSVIARSLAAPAAAERKVFLADDGERLLASVDWQPGARSDAPAAVLVHGQEGTSEAPYMLGTAAKLFAAGWHVVRLNQRGCGESESLTPTLHHGGRGADVAAVLRALDRDEGIHTLAVLGFSLGGAVVLNMLGDLAGELPAGLVAAAVLSPLVNPAHVQAHLDQGSSRAYRTYFLRRMAAHLRRRARLFPGAFPAGERFESDTVEGFDDRFTAPMCGFASAQDYYRRCDPLRRLWSVRVPTLLVHAKDDPIVPFAGYSPESVVGSAAVRCLFPETGGHLGFYAPRAGTDGYWAEDRVVAHFHGRATARRLAA